MGISILTTALPTSAVQSTKNTQVVVVLHAACMFQSMLLFPHRIKIQDTGHKHLPSSLCPRHYDIPTFTDLNLLHYATSLSHSSYVSSSS